LYEELGLPVKTISTLINVPYRTIRDRMRKAGLSSRPFDDLTDEQVDEIVFDILQMFPNIGKSCHIFRSFTIKQFVLFVQAGNWPLAK
jgi:hypothetical protein